MKNGILLLALGIFPIILSPCAHARDAVEEASVWRAEHRIIDLHQHIDCTTQHLARTVKIMDAVGLGIGVNLSGGFVKSRPDAPHPDLQLHFLPVGTGQVSFDEATFQPKGHAFTVLPVLLYPKSRGEIRLASTDPAKAPAIDPRYFADDDDMRLMLEGQRIAQRIVRSKVLDDCRGDALVPDTMSDDEKVLRAAIRAGTSTLFHPVGTCKMGSDAAAVVDASLRVRGVEGLRVVDASIMPSIVGGNTNAPTIMIAEKGADLIRGRDRAQA